ncbi:MAG TPA: Ig-like domain-containing protein [Longimicrobium sp.]|nr:Ig-like domain-containing protein [Longimicrobium sp.]
MQLRFMLALAVVAATAACGGGGAAPVTGGPGGTDALASITITHPEGAVTVGDTIVLRVEARDGAGQPVTNLQPQFSSSDATVATVDGVGVVRGLKEGAASITATVTLGSITKTASYGVAVLAPQQPPQPNPPAAAIAAFALNPGTVSLVAGGTAQLEPVITDASGARVTVLPQMAWSVADPTKAGVANGGVVTALAPGSTTVSASFAAGGRTWTATASVTVRQAAASSATVQGVEDAFTPSTVTITTGGTVTWTMVDEEHDVTWTGAAPAEGNIPRIDDDESATRTFAVAGTYTYTCSRHDGDHGGTVVVNEGAGEAAVFTSVRISPVGPSVTVGGTLLLTATPLDQLGRPMSGLPAAQWSSADATKATVSAGGLVAGVAVGTSVITARITQGGTTREATVTVTVATTGGTTPTPTPTVPLTATVTTPGESFSPANVTIRAGGTVTWQFTGGTRHNVTFQGGSPPPGGNIPDTDGGGSAQRQFPTAGTYNYSCTRHSGMNGTVVVQP